VGARGNRGEGGASNFVRHFIAPDACVGFDFEEGDTGVLSTSVGKSILDGGKEVLVDVDVHFVWLEEEFVDLEEAAKAV